MAESSLYAGERDGARIFRVGRIGFDGGPQDLDATTYTGTLRTERIAPAGNGSLVNFRRVAIHILSSGTYTFTAKVWVDDEQTTLGTGSVQNISISGGSGSLSESTEEIEIEAEGSHIRVEITANSNQITGIFLIEQITARGRVIRGSSGRTGETT